MTLQVADEDKAETALGMTALIFRWRQGSLWLSGCQERRGANPGWSGVDANRWAKKQPRTSGGGRDVLRMGYYDDVPLGAGS